jgi:pectin methylesterase-like acyl-CoA thioesterase
MSKTKLALIAAAGILLASQISSAAVVVGHCKSGLVSFATIQGAVTAVPTGSTIYVCPGTYPEQVEITGKKLALIGVQASTQDAPVLVPPAGTGLAPNATSLSSGNPIAAQIWVHDVDPVAIGVVNISNLAVDGANT